MTDWTIHSSWICTGFFFYTFNTFLKLEEKTQQQKNNLKINFVSERESISMYVFILLPFSFALSAQGMELWETTLLWL